MGQMAKLLSERQQGQLPSNNETNPRTQLKTITTRSGVEIKVKKNVVIQDKTPSIIEEQVDQSKVPQDASQEKDLDTLHAKKTPHVKAYVPPIPFLQRLKKCKNQLDTIFCLQKIRIGEAKATVISLKLADRSIEYLMGIIEDILVKVDKFIFPVDFIILDMEEDNDISLILDRLFLTTGRALIEVHKGHMILRLNDEEVVFNVFKAVKYPMDFDSCFRVDMVDEIVT
ncbi:Uncharacterized protein Adt_44734 [Abeliophyllum distichum]|uniref:Reverse transcriptase domain-containing protein n=1 Tax=Abeliophyllum distichum TaxID=126358 RepID=A0ABD1PBP2_9LAMI